MGKIQARKSHKYSWSIAVAIALLSCNYVAVQARETDSFYPISDRESRRATEAIPWRWVRLVHNLKQHQTVVDSLVFSPDSKILISGGGDNDPQMRFWSVAEGKKLAKVRAQRTAILAMAISPDGKTLVSGGKDSGLNVWDWQTGEYEATFLEHSQSVTSLAVSPDGKVLVSGGLDGIKIWDLMAHPQRPIYTMTGMDNLTNVVAINPNGYIVASGDNQGKVSFWNLRTGTKISDFVPHQDLISGLAFSPDGNILITASHDRTIKIWNLSSGELLNTFTGHTNKIRAIALHPDGQTLASGGNEGILLWNLATGKLLTKLEQHRNWVQALAFSPDGKYLASSGYDFTVKIWEDSLPTSNE